MKSVKKIIIVLIAFLIITSINLSAQATSARVKSQIKIQTRSATLDNAVEQSDSLIRTGEIDLSAIDENEDGKVFQDQMHWNVISDEPGDCPLCGMKLKEVSIDEAKVNLVKNGFAIKRFKSDREIENIKAVDKNQKSVWNKYCPVSGMKISFGSETVEYDGKTIGFCCPSKEHNKIFLEEPEKYIKNLSIDGQTFIGNEQK